jgi:hypothetical protein
MIWLVAIAVAYVGFSLGYAIWDIRACHKLGIRFESGF